jgi:phage baseplate assembly protein W
MARNDYAYPFAIDPISGEAALTTYSAHVAQMIRQVLLTEPGERIDLPDFGCGLRRLVFAPFSDALSATTQLLVLNSLMRWLGDEISVQNVVVTPPEDAPEGQLLVRIDYILIEKQLLMSTQVRII